MKESKNFKVVSERQWRNLQQELAGIREHLDFLEQNLPRKSKRYLRFDECVPPQSICQDVVSMMNGIQTYTGFLGRLAEYYGCESLPFYIDESHTKVSEKAIAAYYPNTKTAYSKESTVQKSTVLHEFFHHLVNLNVVVIDKSQEEKYADRYARAFMQRAGSTS